MGNSLFSDTLKRISGGKVKPEDVQPVAAPSEKPGSLASKTLTEGAANDVTRTEAPSNSQTVDKDAQARTERRRVLTAATQFQTTREGARQQLAEMDREDAAAAEQKNFEIGKQNKESEAARLERSRTQGRGRASTILTGGQGVKAPATTARRTLLG